MSYGKPAIKPKQTIGNADILETLANKQASEANKQALESQMQMQQSIESKRQIISVRGTALKCACDLLIADKTIQNATLDDLEGIAERLTSYIFRGPQKEEVEPEQPEPQPEQTTVETPATTPEQ